MPSDVTDRSNQPATDSPDRDEWSERDLHFSSAGRRGCNATWITPAPRHQPFAAVLYVHGEPGDRGSFRDDALRLIEHGAAALLLEAPWADRESWLQRVAQPEAALDEYRRFLTDMRQSISLMKSSGGVDHGRIAFVGHGLGAMFGTLLAAEHDMIALVLLSGAATFADLAAQQIAGLRGDQLVHYRQALAPIDPIGWIHKAAPAALLFQLADRDELVPRASLASLAEAGSEPKRIDWHHGSHGELIDAGREERLRWLSEKLIR